MTKTKKPKTVIDITQASQDIQRIRIYGDQKPLAERIDDAFGVFFSGKRKPDDTDKLLLELKGIIKSELDKTIKAIKGMKDTHSCDDDNCMYDTRCWNHAIDKILTLIGVEKRKLEAKG